MRYSNLKVEQVGRDGKILLSVGEILTSKEIQTQIEKIFPVKDKIDGFYYGIYNDRKFCLCVKNVSYLGNPHPKFKKRIQIPKSFINAYNSNIERGIITFFIGLYSYSGNVVFVNFDSKNYIYNCANNSSAHVLTIDLLYATKYGKSLKHDVNGNEIFCFNRENIDSFFNMYLLKSIDHTPKLFKVFNAFYDSIDKEWSGISTINQMVKANYHRCFQPEWQSAYIEYLFEQALSKSVIDVDFVKYSPNRSAEGIDLDLYIIESDEYGDIKTHSNNSNSILGNKTETILNCISNSKSVYYIVFNHNTVLDKYRNYEVTRHWNTIQRKSDLMSYSKKMKNSIEITDYMILEINADNINYLNKDFQTDFRNSDGRRRTAKILIKSSNLPNFIVHSYSHLYSVSDSKTL